MSQRSHRQITLADLGEQVVVEGGTVLTGADSGALTGCRDDAEPESDELDGKLTVSVYRAVEEKTYDVTCDQATGFQIR